MKLQIEAPAHLIDVNAWRSTRSTPRPRRPAHRCLVRNTDLAADPRVRRDYGPLARALLAGASGQLRNRRRPRATAAAHAVPVFLDTNQPCTSASRAAARPSRLQPAARRRRRERRLHRTHPSDMAVACAALDATVETVRPDGSTRQMPIAEFTAARDTPQRRPCWRRASDHGRHAPPPLGGQAPLYKVRIALPMPSRWSGPPRSSSRTAPAASRWAEWLTSVARRGGRGRAAARAEAVTARLARRRQPTTRTRSSCRWSRRTLAAALREARS